MEEKKVFEEPVVTKVEFDFNELITASSCAVESSYIASKAACTLE